MQLCVSTLWVFEDTPSTLLFHWQDIYLLICGFMGGFALRLRGSDITLCISWLYIESILTNLMCPHRVSLWGNHIIQKRHNSSGNSCVFFLAQQCWERKHAVSPLNPVCTKHQTLLVYLQQSNIGQYVNLDNLLDASYGNITERIIMFSRSWPQNRACMNVCCAH